MNKFSEWFLGSGFKGLTLCYASAGLYSVCLIMYEGTSVYICGVEALQIRCFEDDF